MIESFMMKIGVTSTCHINFHHDLSVPSGIPKPKFGIKPALAALSLCAWVEEAVGDATQVPRATSHTPRLPLRSWVCPRRSLPAP